MKQKNIKKPINIEIILIGQFPNAASTFNKGLGRKWQYSQRFKNHQVVSPKANFKKRT